MSYLLEILPEASAEIQCATGDYEAMVAGLGTKFRAEVESICGAILQNPLLWRVRSTGFRRVNLVGFPYYVAYYTADEYILVVSVAHSGRRPDYFRNRMP
jgi:toxin ParE1/3/4